MACADSYDGKMAAQNGNALLVKTLYAFKGSNNDELNFQKGDVITVTQAIDGGWWEGTLEGLTGWFPSNYVKELKPDESTDCSPTDGRQESIKLYRNVVLTEITESEKTFVTELTDLQKTYLQPLRESQMLTATEFQTLTGNLDDLADCHRKLLKSLDECSKLRANEQKVGGCFMLSAPRLGEAHLEYCANHPRAVVLLERYKEELTAFMESNGAPAPGSKALTVALSLPFRRLERYRGLLQEMERHIEESHSDRGDVQRAMCVYRDISSECADVRRQKQMELEVMAGNVAGWQGEDVRELGDVLAMSLVTVVTDGRDRAERYLVLFRDTLLLLSVGTSSSGFVFEAKMPLAGITVLKTDDKNVFDISGSATDTMTVHCKTTTDRNRWFEALSRQISTAGNLPARSPSRVVRTPFVPRNQVWVMTCLRPSPPLGPRREPSVTGDHSHREDAQILRVIEAYCASAKSRYTINSAMPDSPQVLIAEEEKIIDEVVDGDRTVVEERSLVDTVYALKDQVCDLQKESSAIAKSLEEERLLRKRLQDVVKQHLVDCPDVVWQD